MKKLFIFSDVHGFYTELEKALKDAGFDKNNSDHIIVSCGDLFDRGKENKKCLNFVNSLPSERKVLICGNHELLLAEMIKKRKQDTWDINNGTSGTVEELTNIYGHVPSALIELKNDENLLKYWDELKYYCEIGNNIFTHAWIPCGGYNDEFKFNEDWRNVSERTWWKATWVCGPVAYYEGMTEENKKIFVGHWHVSRLWADEGYGVEFVKRVETCYYDEKTKKMWPFACYDVYENDKCCFLDACTVVSGKVNVKVLEVTDEEFENRKSRKIGVKLGE